MPGGDVNIYTLKFLDDDTLVNVDLVEHVVHDDLQLHVDQHDYVHDTRPDQHFIHVDGNDHEQYILDLDNHVDIVDHLLNVQHQLNHIVIQHNFVDIEHHIHDLGAAQPGAHGECRCRHNRCPE